MAAKVLFFLKERIKIREFFMEFAFLSVKLLFYKLISTDFIAVFEAFQIALNLFSELGNFYISIKS